MQSVTVSRGGHRWYASVLCKVRQPIPTHPTHRQCAAGTVGLDIGVKTLAALSTGETIANPRHLAFVALQAGPQITSTSSGAALLGSTLFGSGSTVPHYPGTGDDLLPALAGPPTLF